MDQHLHFGQLKWVCAWGEFNIPEDVPVRSFRKDGWFDRRRKVTRELRAYFSAMSDRLRDGEPILGWADWQKATIN